MAEVHWSEGEVVADLIGADADAHRIAGEQAARQIVAFMANRVEREFEMERVISQ